MRSISPRGFSCGGASSRTSHTGSGRGFAQGSSSPLSSLGSPIGLVLALVPEAVYDFYVDAPERLWGLSALEDQQLAGS